MKRFEEASRRAASCAVLVLLLVAAPTGADAVQQSGFAGAYAPANWTTTTGAGDGSVNTSGAPSSIQVIGSDNGIPDQNTDFTIVAAGSGLWSFSFVWDNTDPGFGGFEFDSGGFIHQPVGGSLSFVPYGGPDASGNQAPIAVNAGDLIGYRVNCTDCIFGRGFLTISNFSAPVDDEVTPPPPGRIPEPGMTILLGLGAAGGLALRRLGRRSR